MPPARMMPFIDGSPIIAVRGPGQPPKPMRRSPSAGAELDERDLGGGDADVAALLVGEPQHVDRTGEGGLDLRLDGGAIEIVGELEADLAGGLGDADAYVHDGPFGLAGGRGTWYRVGHGRTACRGLSTHAGWAWPKYVGIVSLTPPARAVQAGAVHSTAPPPADVVIVAFPGMQSLDAVGPFEVFASATQVARGTRRPQAAATRCRWCRPPGGTVTGESGLGAWRPPRCPRRRRRAIDTLVLAGGDGVYEARHDAGADAVDRRHGTTLPAGGHRVHGHVPRREAGLLDGRTVTTHWARADRLAASSRRCVVDPDPIYVRDGNVWTSAGVTAGIDLSLALVRAGPRHRRRPDGGPLAGHVPASARRPDPVRRARVGAAGRAVDRARRAGAGGGRTRRRPPAARAGRRRGDERAPLQPRVHRRGGRHTRPLRRARPRWRPPAATWRPPTTRST